MDETKAVGKVSGNLEDGSESAGKRASKPKDLFVAYKTPSPLSKSMPVCKDQLMARE